MDRGETLRDMPVTLRDMHMDTAGHSPLTDGHHKVLARHLLGAKVVERPSAR